MSITEAKGMAKRYALIYEGECIDSGILEDGSCLATSLEVIAGDDEQVFIEALPVDSLPELPDSGWLEQDGIYRYNDTAYIVRQSHSRMHYEPAETPALFLRYNPNGTEWIVDEKVSVGICRVYDGTEYKCIQSHVTQKDWTPPKAPTLWAKVVEKPQTGEWTAGVWYDIGDVATYDGAEYECRQAHTALVGWEPPNVLALWLPL